MLILPVLIFFAVTLGVIGLFVWLAPTKTAQRLQAMSNPAEKPQWTETMVNIVGPFAKLSSPTGNWETSPLRIKFLNAGIRHIDARLIYFGIKTLLPLAFAAMAFLGLRTLTSVEGTPLLLFVVLSAMIGCYLPNILLHWKIRNRRREIFENFPDAADLMLICVEAGLGLDAGLAKVVDEIKMKSVALAEELHLTNLEMRAGGTREKSLRNLALRTGVDEIGTFAAMLTQADKFGTSIGESLRVFSDDLRYKRHVRAEEMAAKVPTKMLFPLITCIFPAIIMVIMGPAAIQIIRTVLPLISGVH
ncbi:type II secretion system F family protein [Collimonas silvisoli]|uniref:type II secretion system F family protein n=1 Tax=Collimonas silvisoli TaxID=2825884 RepID=UPI001B8BF25A|nr:type II secretion system F family protein [Collimonas silvisoli]